MFSSEIIFLTAGPIFLVAGLSAFDSFTSSLLSISLSLDGVDAVSLDSENSPITSALETISPSDFMIFVITPSD